MHENEIATIVFKCAIEVHKKFGPGLLENVYDVCLAHKIREMGLLVDCQVGLPVSFENVRLQAGYRLDQLIEKKVVVEVKAVEGLNEIHFAQVLTYLKLSSCKLGLLINFNSLLLKNGVRRVINGNL